MNLIYFLENYSEKTYNQICRNVIFGITFYWNNLEECYFVLKILNICDMVR